MLRQFLYLDHPLVRDFISSLEGGVFDQSRELKSSDGKRGLEGKATVGPVSGGVTRAGGTREESESVVHQTAASEFERLYAHLEADGLQVYDRIDTTLEDLPVRRKDIIEVDARLRVSGLHALMDLLGMFAQAAPLIQQFGAGEQVDAEMFAGIQALTALNENSAKTSLIGTILGGAEVALALELQTSNIRTQSWDIEATVLLKVQRMLRPGQTEIVGDPFGGLMSALPAAQRKEFLSRLQSEDLAQYGVGPSEVRYPAVVGTPIAIYR